MKKTYDAIDLKIIRFNADDVLTTSTEDSCAPDKVPCSVCMEDSCPCLSVIK